MALRSTPPTSRPDHTNIQVGDKGQPILQEADKMVVRSGAPGSETDFDIVSNDACECWDLVGDGDFNIPGDSPDSRTEPPNIGGTSMISGGVVSHDDVTFDITFTWLNDYGDPLLSETYSSSTSTEFSANQAIQIDRLWVKSDFLEIVITDTSGGGQNEIAGSLNVHT